MNIGIITVLYKSEKVIDGFIKSLNNQKFSDFHVLFVENEVDSNFCEEKIIATANFKYDFIRSSSNVGVAAGNNRGIEFFENKENISHLMFLNNDIEFNDDFLLKHKKIMLENNIDALSPKMYFFNPPEKIWYAGGELSWLKNGPRHYGHNKKEKLFGKSLYLVTYAPTCSLLIKKDILKKNNIKMMEQLFVYYDDYVFCMDLYKAGVKLYYSPDVVLYHKISSSTGSNSDFSKYYQSRNWAYLARKFKNINIITVVFLMLFNYIVGNKIENSGLIDSFKLK